MAQPEQSVAQEITPRDGITARSVPYPLIVALVAVAFAANAWFFYNRGHQDASDADSDLMPHGQIAWTREEPSQSPITAPDGDVAQQPVSAGSDNAKSMQSDTPATDKPAPKRVIRAKTTNRTMLAKTTKPITPPAMAMSDRHVALLSHPQPSYPVSALREHQQGTVLVMAQVDVSGRVSDTHIVRHSGSYTLDRAAMNEVRRWKFEPAMHNGQAVAANVEVPVSYRLDQ